MKKRIFLFATISTIFLLMVALAPLFSTAASPMARKIVVFRSGVLNEPSREALMEKFGAIKVKDVDLIEGKAVLLPLKAEKALRQHPGVLRIDDDVIVEALVRSDREKEEDINIKVKPLAVQPAEKLPWGIDRIDAEKIWNISSADPIKVAVIDTGIDVKHPDLQNNLKGGFSAVSYTKSYNDDNGHGTHVAGIIGAVDNAIGVIGVGPKIDLYGVKVLDRRGSGYLSDVIEGIDWAIANGINVINMSLGTTADVQSFRDAVIRANQAGIVQVAAAGNSGGAVNYPAAYSQVIAVSATDNTDTIASWSSRGPEIDLAAPGVNIYSTYKGQTYKTLSGTSMASPHVAGVASLVLTTLVGLYDLDGDGAWDPNEVQNKLQATAEDLGISNYDTLYGHGLTDAEKAVIQ